MNYTVADIIKELNADGQMIIRGFGTFRVVEVAERKHRNPKTGETVVKPAHKTVRFKASKSII